MGDLILQLLPLALGIVLSPLAIMALVAILVSKLGAVWVYRRGHALSRASDSVNP